MSSMYKYLCWILKKFWLASSLKVICVIYLTLERLDQHLYPWGSPPYCLAWTLPASFPNWRAQSLFTLQSGRYSGAREFLQPPLMWGLWQQFITLAEAPVELLNSWLCAPDNNWPGSSSGKGLLSNGSCSNEGTPRPFWCGRCDGSNSCTYSWHSGVYLHVGSSYQTVGHSWSLIACGYAQLQKDL